jgi:hypothetical protein
LLHFSPCYFDCLFAAKLRLSVRFQCQADNRAPRGAARENPRNAELEFQLEICKRFLPICAWQKAQYLTILAQTKNGGICPFLTGCMQPARRAVPLTPLFDSSSSSSRLSSPAPTPSRDLPPSRFRRILRSSFVLWTGIALFVCLSLERAHRFFPFPYGSDKQTLSAGGQGMGLSTRGHGQAAVSIGLANRATVWPGIAVDVALSIFWVLALIFVVAAVRARRT